MRSYFQFCPLAQATQLLCERWTLLVIRELIVVSCSLTVMTSIWICQRTLDDAVQHGDIRILGKPALTRRLRQWLGASGLSALGERGDTSTLLSKGIVF